MIVKVLKPEDVARTLATTDKVLRGAQRVAVLEAATVGAELLAEAAPVDRGRLKQSFRVRRKGVSGHPEIVASAPYAGIVEMGSRPHWAPLAPLVRWVRRHAKLFNLSSAGTGRDKRGRFTVGAFVRIARGIQRKIAREGTKPRWFVKQRLPQLSSILNACLHAAKNRALARLGSP